MVCNDGYQYEPFMPFPTCTFPSILIVVFAICLLVVFTMLVLSCCCSICKPRRAIETKRATRYLLFAVSDFFAFVPFAMFWRTLTYAVEFTDYERTPFSTTTFAFLCILSVVELALTAALAFNGLSQSLVWILVWIACFASIVNFCATTTTYVVHYKSTEEKRKKKRKRLRGKVSDNDDDDDEMRIDDIPFSQFDAEGRNYEEYGFDERACRRLADETIRFRRRGNDDDETDKNFLLRLRAYYVVVLPTLDSDEKLKQRTTHALVLYHLNEIGFVSPVDYKKYEDIVSFNEETPDDKVLADAYAHIDDWNSAFAVQTDLAIDADLNVRLGAYACETIMMICVGITCNLNVSYATYVLFLCSSLPIFVAFGTYDALFSTRFPHSNRTRNVSVFEMIRYFSLSFVTFYVFGFLALGAFFAVVYFFNLEAVVYDALKPYFP